MSEIKKAIAWHNQVIKETCEDFEKEGHMYSEKLRAEIKEQTEVCQISLIALQEKQEHRWIPVSERLPEWNCKVLACYCFGGHTNMLFMNVLDYYAFDETPHFQHELGVDGMKVTHWMTLPEPPKED